MKVGFLRKRTYINTVSNMRIVVPKNTRVTVDGAILRFHLSIPVTGFRNSDKYYVTVAGTTFLLEPFNPRVPYPFSML